jgi:hypothetical protein
MTTINIISIGKDIFDYAQDEGFGVWEHCALQSRSEQVSSLIVLFLSFLVPESIDSID